MLNQPEQTNQLHECLDSKDALGCAVTYHSTDADSTNEGDKLCGRCKDIGSAAAAKRNLNHRAKVTVQRRANTNQKVVSLSFDKAIELTHSANINILDTAGQVSVSSRRFEDSNVDTVEDKQMLCKADCGSSTLENTSLSTNLHFSKENNGKARGHDNSEIASITSSDKPEAWLPEDEVSSFSTEDESQNIAPPPIRLRQAWASPTLARKQRTASVPMESKATNTEFTWQKNKQSLKGTSETSDKKVNLKTQADSKTDNSRDFEKQCSPGSERTVDDSRGDPTNGLVERKQKKKKQIDIKIPQTDQSVDDERSSSKYEFKKLGTEQMKSDKKTIPPEDEVNNKNVTNITTDTKSHGMGDAEIVHECNEKQLDSETVTYPGDTDSTSESKRAKNKKAKKMGANLFSWSPFKRKPHLKQTTSKSKFEISLGKATSKDYMSKTSMADVLYRQARVDIPQSITEMFAASNPEKVATVDQNHQEKK
ncbi:hypothetical protein RRG08_002207 [Elysia crispata]|uniref:Uncharacterized protein n=1 Tax=Elysia crispata TaxID=231223 RepID=A0AAE0ZAP1_9GAST|nr:hypothetical protein RRG08_002207 [Elysia crispata]